MLQLRFLVVAVSKWNRIKSFFLSSSFVSHFIWFICFNVIFALLPLGISFGIRSLSGIPAPPGVYAPELLFFSVAISATMLRQLYDEKYTNEIRWFFDLVKATLFVGVVVAAAFFGAYQYASITNFITPSIQYNITPFSLVLGSILLAVCLAAELVIAYSRTKQNA